ncbi:MAG TPA: ABC transporter ATP-binding protein [Gemmataceae bacterium]|nr:ABC transporter ATP-binding protein [Gemmataceae bacterium]
MSLLVKNLCKTYPTRSGDLVVLRDVNLTLQPGEALGILGPSGSGKSTLLYLLGTLERATSGTYQLGDKHPFQLSDRELAHFRNRSIGFVFQDHHLLPQCSVLENVLIPVLAGGATNAEPRARQLLERVGLSHRLDHRPAELSGGERQRVAVARALIHQPLLVLADEPTGNLDRKTAQTVGELLIEMHQQEKTMLIVVTHSAELAKLLPRRMEMLDGTLVEAGAMPSTAIQAGGPA